MTKEQKELCDEIYNKTGIDVAYEIENDMPESIDDLIERLEELVSEIEVIYHHNAMEYLSEHDPSLENSLGIAHDMGYTVENLNSETLATLLKQQDAREAIYNYRDELEASFFPA